MKKASLLIAAVLVAGLVACSGGKSNQINPDQINLKNITLDSFSDLESIVVTLRWDESYETAGLLDFLIKDAGAELPPEYQEHYKQTFTFDHNAKKVTKKFMDFTGMDETQMQSGNKDMGEDVYNQFRAYLFGEVICEVASGHEGFVGPATPRIEFRTKSGSVGNIYFAGDQMSEKGDLELCSNDFSEFLTPLLINN